MTTPLTALERDLLACVERLVTACEVSAKELSGLEERSTTKMQSQMERGLELREAAHATRDQLEISEGRREAVERELEEREVEMDRGMTH
jgi:hypothetical protein